MKFDEIKYQTYVNILKEELVPAMGCTEPIAIAYCGSLLRDTLGNVPTKIIIKVSGNIIKNVKSVIVPHTNGLYGIDTAACVGILAGKSDKELQVISEVSDDDIKELPIFIKKMNISIEPANNEHVLYIEIVGYFNDDVARVVISDSHTHVSLIEKNNVVLYNDDKKVVNQLINEKKSLLNIEDIVKFADIVKIEDVKKVLDRQIQYNMSIANEGLNNKYGANIGKTILKYSENNIVEYCKALAASGSDARMNGCNMPVVINSGSGNQGITASVPVIAYSEKKGIDKELLYRALVVSNLCTIHIKNSIGKLSAFCGVVIAGAGSGAGIAYLEGGKFEEVAHTLVNSLAIISGVLCDGAKSSCAAKIASSVEAGFLGYYMYKEGNEFIGGDGIVKKGVENTIKAIGELAREGMCETDKEIIHIMIDK